MGCSFNLFRGKITWVACLMLERNLGCSIRGKELGSFVQSWIEDLVLVRAFNQGKRTCVVHSILELFIQSGHSFNHDKELGFSFNQGKRTWNLFFIQSGEKNRGKELGSFIQSGEKNLSCSFNQGKRT